MEKSSDYRARARAKLSGKWKKAVFISLAYFFISFILNFIEGLFSGALATIFSLIVAIIEIPLGFGLVIAFFKFFNDDEVKSFDFLSLGFSNFKKSWSISLRIVLKLIVPIILILVGAVLLTFGVAQYSAITGVYSSSNAGLAFLGLIVYIVGFIWAIMQSYYYQLSYVVAADDESLSSKEVVEKCKEAMQGKRGKLFCLEFSFIGWSILATFTFGIGMLWLLPYMQGAMIEFAKDALGSNELNSNDSNTNDNEDVNPIQ